MHPAYFNTRFHLAEEEAPDWPGEFVILSAYATTGERWSPDENDAASEALHEALLGRDVWIAYLTGYAPDSGHAEPSYATDLTLDDARALGRRFRQDAIFHVRGDDLFVTRCLEDPELVAVGSFRERVDVGRSGGRLGNDDDDPWPRISPERFCQSIDARLVDDDGVAAEGARVFRPRDRFTLGDIAIDAAMPDDKPLLRPEVETDYWPMPDLAARLPWIGDIGTVVECSVTDSMVSSEWGLGEFAIGDRGYVYHITDYEGFDHGSPEVLGAWEPKTDRSARHACVVSCYARTRDRIGLPPLRLGQSIDGDPDLLIACLLRILEEPLGKRASWDEIVNTVLSTEWIHFRSRTGLDAVSQHFGITYARLSRAAWSIEASDFLPSIAANDATHAKLEAVAALYLGCITWGLQPEPDESQWLGPVNELCGSWKIGYADDEGMIEEEGPVERLDLHPDGTYSWEPEPTWLGGSGVWGVETPPSGEPRLCFDTYTGDRHCHYLVLHQMPELGTFFHLQRTRADAVVFRDRILRGYRLEREQ